MKGARQRERQRRRAKPGVARFRARAAAVVAALALVFQLLVLPYHQALSTPVAGPAAVDVASIGAELKATFGEAASLCIQADDKGAPIAPAGDCADRCPLCQFAAQAVALVAPDLPVLPERLDAACRTLGVAPATSAVPVWPIRQNRARAPPFAV